MEKDIGKVKKNEQTEIVLKVDDYGGKIGLTIREYTHSEKYTGFTKAGTRIPLESFDAFKKMINSITPNDLKKVGQSSLPDKKAQPKENIEDIPAEDLI